MTDNTRMQEFAVFRARIEKSEREPFAAFLVDANVTEFVEQEHQFAGGRWLYDLQIPIDDPRMERLAAEGPGFVAKKNGFRLEHHLRKWTRKELEAAEWLGLWPLSLRLVEGPRWEHWDDSAVCSSCRAGLLPRAPFPIDMAGMKKSRIATLGATFDLIVTPGAREAIEDAGLTGVEFLPCAPKSSRATKRELYVMTLPYRWPRLEYAASLISRYEDACDDCDRSGYRQDTENGAARLVYRQVPQEAPDLGRTFETFGGSFGGHAADRRLMVISQKAYRVLRSLERRVHVEPIELRTD